MLWLCSVVSCTCITAGGSRYRPSGGGGGMGMRPSGIGGGADPLTGTALYMHVCLLFRSIWYIILHVYTNVCCHGQRIYMYTQLKVLGAIGRRSSHKHRRLVLTALCIPTDLQCIYIYMF